jgi:hypothetical protein
MAVKISCCSIKNAYQFLWKLKVDASFRDGWWDSGIWSNPPPPPKQILVQVRVSPWTIAIFLKTEKEEEIHENERHQTSVLQSIYELFYRKVIH